MTTSSIFSPPVIVTALSPLTPPTHYIAPGSTFSTNLTITDSNSILGLRLDSILPLPEGAWLNGPIITGANSVVYEFLWEPVESQAGDYLPCFVSTDGHGMKSTPSCVRIVVMEMASQVCLNNKILESST